MQRTASDVNDSVLGYFTHAAYYLYFVISYLLLLFAVI